MQMKQHGWKEQLGIYGPAALLVIGAFFIAFQFIKPAPPDRVVIGTGHPQGAYHSFASRYQDILAREGITLELRSSAGSVENIALLQSGQVDAAFVQGGTAPAESVAGLNSLGSLYFEPLWLFHRDGILADRLIDLKGLRVAVGARGSGTHQLVMRLLADNDLSPENLTIMTLDSEAAVAALQLGEVDAAFFVTSASSALVARLLASPGINLASFQRAQAYARRYRFLNNLTLPEGAVDLAANVPERETRLLAPTANLVAGPELHPAITDLLLLAAEEVHGPGGGSRPQASSRRLTPWSSP